MRRAGSDRSNRSGVSPWTKRRRHYSRDDVALSLAQSLEGLGPDRYVVQPAERLRFAVQIERSRGEPVSLQASIPAGSAPARRALLEHGWEPTDGATRYYRRTFVDPDTAFDAIVDAYRVVYGSVDDEKGWNIVTPAMRPRVRWPRPWVGEAEPGGAAVETPQWVVPNVSGIPHLVTVDEPGGRTFRCDGRAYTLGRSLQRTPRVTDFRLADGRAARLTMRVVVPRARVRLRRAFGGSLTLGSLVAFLFGAGMGAGVAAASATATMMEWVIYTLNVEGADLGSWVVRKVGGVAESAVLVTPGAELPDGSTDCWPLPAR